MPNPKTTVRLSAVPHSGPPGSSTDLNLTRVLVCVWLLRVWGPHDRNASQWCCLYGGDVRSKIVVVVIVVCLSVHCSEGVKRIPATKPLQVLKPVEPIKPTKRS